MVKIKVKIVLIFLFCLIAGHQLIAQKKVELKSADNLYGGIDENGENFNSPVGNVVFLQNETTIYCDSAIFYESTNTIKAFGHVKITDGDSVTITSKTLFYNGNTKKAELRNDVVFTKLEQLTLYTDFLDYYRQKQEARYFNGGKVVDSTNVLTSEKGYYHVDYNLASFKKNVVGTNPDYTLKSDTMQYNTKTKVVFFRAPTELTDVEGNVFNYEEGQYNTLIKKSDLYSGEIESESYVLTGDKLFLDDIRKYYTVTNNVEMISKEQDIIITGDFSFYNRKNGFAKVYGNALMKKIMKEDTLYITADTLMAIESEDEAKKRLLAYKDVKIFKKDLQGIADSLAYVNIDSIIYFYDDPVLWTGTNQMTADSINLKIVNNTIDKLNMTDNSFVVSKDSIANYNQIKGRDMVAYFEDDAIKKVDVNGNGESLFFALDETDQFVVGMNKIICSNIIINFKENTADNISFYVRPDASFIPPHELTKEMTKLKGFQWREEQKPELQQMLDGKIQIISDADREENKAKEKPELTPEMLLNKTLREAPIAPSKNEKKKKKVQ
ncbi:Organic solvent tolerance protein OstA [Fulvivirga sp. M361]|uniref:OstA-like protein n=1 Tax=Fulvivirga sp. M361 TaxID=2594266 RepID=UPI00117BCD3A|nr:OstA-like protein [Fulvivirga sp. M361]TRX52014.1 Organic solvent tolerance protein OstA [Fulvivirga sp. M361]